MTTPNKISAKLFRPWIRSKHGSSNCFINTPVKEEKGRVVVAGELELVINEGMKESQTSQLPNSSLKEYYVQSEYVKYKEMCPELTYLEVTFQRQEIGN